MKSAKPERNKEIVERINAGHAPADLARFFGIHRERIRQIYKKATGINPKISEGWKKRRLIQYMKQEAKVEEYLSEKFKCAHCEVEIERRDQPHFNKYCKDCIILYRTGNKRLNVKITCDGCGVIYVPFASAYYRGLKLRSAKHYHNMACYNNFRPKINDNPIWLAKLRESLKNRVRLYTPEWRKNMSDAQKRRYARERELQTVAEGLLHGMQPGDSMEGKV